MSLDRDALDRWITNPRYSESYGWVTCADCGEQTLVHAETEYGRTGWEPGECGECGHEFTGQEDWQDDEPPEPEHEPAEYRRFTEPA